MSMRDKAMLARVSISQWSGRRFDKEATVEVERAHGGANMGRFNKMLVDPALLKPIAQAGGAIRNYHYKHTLPWDDSDNRLLPAACYLDYCAGFQPLEAAFWLRVDEAMAEYEAEIQRSQQRLGTLFKLSEYPTVNELRGRFRVRWSVNPLPNAQDFRVDITEEEQARMQANIEAQLAEATNTAVRDIWNQLYKVVSKMHERLSDPAAVFRDSLVDNVEQLCQLVPKLNFTEDPEIERFGKEIKQQLASFAPATLRDSQYARQQTASNAESIMKAMEGFMNA